MIYKYREIGSIMSLTSSKSLLALALATFIVTPCTAQNLVAKNTIKDIAEEAYIYSFPMTMGYGIMHAFSVDKNSGLYRGPFNQIFSPGVVFTPQDVMLTLPNNDTLYSFISMDLRAEPIILCVPQIAKNRYYTVQLINQYTTTFAYIGTRTTGNGAGCYGIAGPYWQGPPPKNIKKMLRSETQFATAIFRTQLFNIDDLDHVKKIQHQYKAQTLSEFLHSPKPPTAPVIVWPIINRELAQGDPFNYLGFLLQFAPAIGTAAVEEPLRARFAELDIVAGQPFALSKFTAEQQNQIIAGMKQGMDKIRQEVPKLGKKANNWTISTNDSTKRNDWTRRAAIAMSGIYANDPVETLYVHTVLDGEGQPIDTSKFNYTLTFPAGKLPPVNAFWSLTLYDGQSELLIENPLKRYLINSLMEPKLLKNADGSVTLYIQKNTPGKDKEANWLPAPAGPVFLFLRLYWPKESALQGEWLPPVVVKDKNTVVFPINPPFHNSSYKIR